MWLDRKISWSNHIILPIYKFTSLLLQPDQDLPLRPEFFKPVIIAAIRREQVQDNIPKIDQQPTILGCAFYASFKLILLTHTLDSRICQSAKHPITGTGADHKIIRKI